MAYRKLLLAGLLAFFLLAGSMAMAQSWVAPASPQPEALGPNKAKGAVIWSHGRSLTAEDWQAPSPPYLAALRQGGWDTFRFNRIRESDQLHSSSQALVAEVHRLKAMGYRRIALAGQSFGAFLALMAADNSDEVDAVIATAPAAFGNFSEFYDSWRSNATRLYPLLEEVKRARVMVFYFHGDDFDPGGRGDRSREILAAHHHEYLVVDQPPQLTSHWAATTPLFVSRFGACILGFLDATRVEEGASCQNDGYWAGLHPVSTKSAAAQGTEVAK
ncbi:MAG TPA: alpha/beta fold hydrolase [Stellaceae bacterium]|nr:alpha/beta fold hydrolase [Stellaceae bacterium]